VGLTEAQVREPPFHSPKLYNSFQIPSSLCAVFAGMPKGDIRSRTSARNLRILFFFSHDDDPGNLGGFVTR
jgi:hypothetical protein